MTDKRHIIFATAAFFLMILAGASLGKATGGAAPIKCNLSECVEMALRSNQQILASDRDIDLSRGKLYEAHPRGIPVTKYEYRLAPVPQDIDNPADSFFSGDISVLNSVKIEFGSPITTFGKIKTVQELASLGIDASWFKRQKTSDDIVFRIHQIYNGILLARELLFLADQSQDALNDKITGLEKERVLDQLQILKLKVALYEVVRRAEEGKKKEQLALAGLKIQMGLPLSADVEIKDNNLSAVRFVLKPLDDYIAEAEEYLPEFKLLATGLKAKQKQLALEKKQPVPSLGAGGFFEFGRAPFIRGGDDTNSFTNPFNFTKLGIGFQLKGEFDYVKNRAKKRQAEADLLKTTFEKNTAVEALKLDLKRTYLDVVEASNLMKQASDAKKAARQMVFLTRSNLDIGIGEKKDYLDALQSYLIFQGRELEAIFNYNVAVSELKKKTGHLYKQQRKEIQ